jgi:hypothetical protein
MLHHRHRVGQMILLIETISALSICIISLIQRLLLVRIYMYAIRSKYSAGEHNHSDNREYGGDHDCDDDAQDKAKCPKI